jgi:hypothetical protein
MACDYELVRYGFDSAVLPHGVSAEDALDLSLASGEWVEACGLFLVSNNTTKPKSKTNNRKRELHRDTYLHHGTEYHINSEGSGIYVEILGAMLEQFEVAQHNWRRVFVYRFDLHKKNYAGNNEIITRFRKRLFPKLKRRYGFKDIGFTWAREIERAKAQHYHFVLFLDGNKIRHPSALFKIIRKTWEDVEAGNTMPVIKNPYHFIDDGAKVMPAIYHISYLAKVRAKGYRDAQAKDYGASRMKRTVNRG